MINDYDPIAGLYDLYVPATYDIEFFFTETRTAFGEVLELMSGTGRVSIPLLEAGVRLTCVDLSAQLNAMFQQKLQQRGLQAEIYQMDVCELDLPKQFSMVIIPFHSFSHLTSQAQQETALQRIYQHLLPGGVFICTLGNPEIRKQTVDGQLRLFRKYPLPEDQGSLLLWITESFDPADQKVVHASQFFEIYDPHGLMESRRVLELHFRLSDKEEFDALARQAGFIQKAFYGDYSYGEFNPGASPYMIWILEKPDQPAA